MGCRGKCTFISATNKENFEEFRERVYEAVRHIHITRFHNKFYIQITKMPSKKKTKTTKKSSNFLYNINILTLWVIIRDFFYAPAPLQQRQAVTLQIFVPLKRRTKTHKDTDNFLSR
jgi:hypothetical protein